MKRKIIQTLLAVAFLSTALVSTAEARWGKRGFAKSGEFSISASIGQGWLYDELYEQTVAKSPLNGEILVQYALNPWATIDLGVMFGHDWGNSSGKSSATLVGARPGIHLYLPLWWHSRPYFRLAIPFYYRSGNDPDSFYAQIMAGIGFEYRWKHVGIFIEVTAAPVMRGDTLVPIDMRIGVATHF